MNPKGRAAIRDTDPRPRAATVTEQDPFALERGRPMDLVLIGAILALLVIGTVEIYSASAVFADQRFNDPHYFLKRQLAYVFMGLGALALGARLDYDWLRRWAYPLLGTALVLLASVLLVGTRVNSATRWFHLGPLSFQPVEFAKLALVAYLATSLAKKRDKLHRFTVGFMPHVTVCGLMVGLLLLQPDLGSSIILGCTTLLLLFAAGTKLFYLLVLMLTAAPLGYHAIVGTPWRMRRLLAYIDPWQFQQGAGYQVSESLISIGSGGIRGLGLGDGRQKLFYLPEAHTDFIMSNVGEELGFIGFAVVLLIFGVLVWRGIRAALGARDLFGTYVAFGITCIFGLQALVNTAVVLGAIPAKGLTLPFMSYGGTSLLMSMFCAGVLLNIGQSKPLRHTDLGAFVQATRNRRRRRRHSGRVKPVSDLPGT